MARARARKRASSPLDPPELMEEEEESRAHDEMEDEQGLQPLQFGDPLIWRAGRPIPVAQLLRRLETLAEELQSIDQEEAVRKSLVSKAQELASPLLLAHKDSGVKACTLVCIVEMFRLLAPDAPYKGRELRDIFTLVVSTIVPALANPSDSYNAQHMHVLSSLGSIKSICLLDGIPGGDHLITTLFSNCFDVLSGNVRGNEGEHVGKNVEYHMTAMTTTLVDECDALPSSAVEVILAQFLRVDPNALSSAGKKTDASTLEAPREVSPAYNMARAICNTCHDKMVRYVGQYFSSVLIDASEHFSTVKPTKSKSRKRTHDDSEDEDEVGLLTPPSDEDLQEVDKAHHLLRELWRCCPDVTRNVIPQVDAEISAESLQLRILAVQTVGDMTAGVGAAGPPVPVVLEPAAYPSQSVVDVALSNEHENALLRPSASLAFSSVYPAVYQDFMDRHRDKIALVRSAWVTAAGRILYTSGGGKGLNAEQQSALLRRLSDMLLDQDEKVRLAAVQTIAHFDFNSIIQKLGSHGGVSTQGSVLSNLAGRIKDPKRSVRAAAMDLLGRIWGVASGAMMEGNDRIGELVRDIPAKIFEAWYVNEPILSALIQSTLYDSMLPIGWPPIKAKSTNVTDSLKISDTHDNERHSADPDRLRVERLLLLLHGLEEKSKKVFFALLQHQAVKAKYLELALQHSEKIHAESAQTSHKEDKKELEALIDVISKPFPDKTIASDHFNTLFKHADRRSFALMRFCISAESDYRKVVNAMRELIKRLEQAPSNVSATLDTIAPFMQQASLLFLNRSHVPAIMDIARTGHNGLGPAAHEILKEMSTKAPDVFKVNIKELCESLKSQVPSPSVNVDWQSVASLKACAGFARRFPQGMAKDRDFYRAMAKFAMHGMPPTAAKQAVTIITASADRKEMYLQDIIKYCLEDFRFGTESFLARLAALSQLRLLANRETTEFIDPITSIAVEEILSKVRTVASEVDPVWVEDVDEDLDARLWALKIVVNGLRGYDIVDEGKEPAVELKAAAEPVFRLLNTLVAQEGELSKTKRTPKTQAAHLRLAAAKHLLKLCSNRLLDKLFSQRDFNRLAMIVQDPMLEVRAAFNTTLKKYLGQDRLPARFYSLVFVYAYEPSTSMNEATATWLRSRAKQFAARGEHVLEGVFSRFLSLLAHHQDFGTSNEQLEEFVRYIVYYLKAVATESNLPQIYGIAQRIKTVRDGIDPEKSDHLYALSDLAESLLRAYQEFHGWSLQILSVKVQLPVGLFAPMPSRAIAQEISEKRFIPEELAESLEGMLKDSMRTKKRKSDGRSDRTSKRTKDGASTSGKPVHDRKVLKGTKQTKTPRKTKDILPSSERRKSTRQSNARSYAENDDSDDDQELEEWQILSDERAKEGSESSTPPTSDVVHAVTAEDKENAQSTRANNKVRGRAGRAKVAARKKGIMDIPSDSE